VSVSDERPLHKIREDSLRDISRSPHQPRCGDDLLPVVKVDRSVGGAGIHLGGESLILFPCMYVDLAKY
jgi:hypothetical protein